jgi:GNAT superfamily N-acetyltransferase
MSRRIHDLTLARLDELPDPCRSCMFWESARARRGPQRPDGLQAKEAWLQATQLEWGAPGKVVEIDGRTVAYGLFAPAGHFPRARRVGRVASEDALLLATCWVTPEVRGGGVGKVLLHALLRETHKRGARALEAYGARPGDPSVTCAIPEGFLLANGFAILHDDPEWPLLRLDLRQTVRESVGHALDTVRSALAPRREPAPAPVRGNSAARSPQR